MDEISVLIESICGIRDHDFRLIEEKQVEGYKNLPQMLLGPCGSDCGERRAHDRGWFSRPGAIAVGPGGPIDRVLQDSRDGVRPPTGKLWRSFRRTADCPPIIFLSPSVALDISQPPLLDEAAEVKFGHGHLFSFSSCKSEFRGLG